MLDGSVQGLDTYLDNIYCLRNFAEPKAYDDDRERAVAAWRDTLFNQTINNMEPKTEQIKLYGAIYAGDNNAASFIANLQAAQEKKPQTIELHIHCPGGDVFEGNLIYNAIKDSPVPVDAYIDGIAASMASVIMLAARNVYMAENAFIMIHAPHTFSCGNAEDLEKSAKLLRDLEAIFTEKFAARTGKTQEEVSAWLQGDNWFNAKEALEEKLIDGIVGKSDIKLNDTEGNLKKTTANALLQRFEAITTIINQPQNKQEMDKQAIISRYGLTTVTAESSDEDVLAAIEAKINEGKQEAEAVRQAQIKAAIDNAVAEKKISEQQRATYEAIGNANGIETLNQVLADIRVMPTPITAKLNSKQGNPEDRAGWNFDKWQTEDPRGLEEMEKNDPEAFKALYEAEFGK